MLNFFEILVNVKSGSVSKLVPHVNAIYMGGTPDKAGACKSEVLEADESGLAGDAVAGRGRVLADDPAEVVAVDEMDAAVPGRLIGES